MNVSAAQLCDDLIRLLGCVKTQTAILAETKHITKVQVFALYAIHQRGTMSMGQIAETLHCDASNITGIVDRLVSQGLLVREEAPQDRRTKHLRLTDKGEEIIASLKEVLPKQLGCDKLSEQERQHLHKIISKICA